MANEQKQDINIEVVSIDDLVQDDHNFNRGTEEGAQLIERSFREHGAGRSVFIDRDNRLVGGNKAQKGFKAAGKKKVIIVDSDADTLVAVRRKDVSLDTAEGRRMAYLDNLTTQVNLSWDQTELEAVQADVEGFEVSDFGYEIDSLPQVTFGSSEGEQKGSGNQQQPEAKEDDFDPDVVHESKVHRGEVWQLGDHRLMCGDSTSSEDVARLMNGQRADLVFTDPPYGMKKESEGVLNDNLNFDDLLEFNKRWIPLTFANLKDNGSWYCWGIDEPLMDIYANILKPMQKRNEITFRNLITWFKNPSGCGDGQNNSTARSYGRITEKCLFVMCGKEDYNINTDNYFEGWEPVRLYLEGEAQSVGLDGKKVEEICGVGMYSHWFTKSQWGFIPQKHYAKLQAYYNGKAFTKSYEELDAEFKKAKAEFERIKQEWYATRAYFDNTHDLMTEVWQFDRVTTEERMAIGHATPKPIALCSRAIKTSSREGETVLDVFGGSGSTMIACEQLGRKCYMMELDPKYCDVIIARWEKLTGRKAEKTPQQ